MNARLELIGMLAAISVGEISLVTMPFIVGAMVQHFGMQEGFAGVLMSCQIGSMAVSSFVLSIYYTRVDLRIVAFVAVIMAVLGNGIAILTVDSNAFIFSRILVGLGEGVALAISNAVAAGTARPHRTFSILSFAYIAMATVMFSLLPIMIEKFGYIAVFYTMLGVTLVIAPGFFFVPGTIRSEREKNSQTLSMLKNHFAPVLAFGMLFFAANGLWAYSERIGVSINLSVTTISHIFLATAVLGLAAPVIADFTGRRIGMANSFLVGMFVYVPALLAWGYAVNAMMFASGKVFSTMSFLYLVPFYKTIITYIDPTGRLPAAAAGMQTAATAIAPGVMGLVLLAGGNYRTAVWIVVVVIIISVITVLGTARKADRSKYV